MHPEQVEEILAELRVALEAGRVDDAMSFLARLHPADQAEAFRDLDEPAQRELFTKLDSHARADLFEEMPEDEAAEIAADLAPAELADVLDEMSPEGAADILSELPEEQAASTLEQMEEATEVEPLLQYRTDTAGGLMSPEFIALRGDMTAGEVIEHLRAEVQGRDIPYYLYVIDRGERLQGVVPLRALITAPPLTPISQFMNPDVISATVDTDQEELARISKRYRLLLLPIVDGHNRLVGVVKSADLVEVIEEEATEDIFRLGGVSDGHIQVWSPLRRSVGRRLPWLLVNLFTAFLAAWVVSRFEATLAKVAVLAVFQGIIAGQGGNAGTQTLTLIVRGLALGELHFSDVFKVLLREALIGVVHGVVIGVAVGFGAYLWMDKPMLGVIAAVAMLGNMVAAAIAGTIIPIVLRAVRLDPALASGVLVTTVTDCVGFGLFLYLATVFIDRL